MYAISTKYVLERKSRALGWVLGLASDLADSFPREMFQMDSSRHLEVPRLGGRCSLSRPVRLLFTLVVTCDSPVKLGISSYADWPGGEPPVKGLFHPMVVCLFPTDVSVLSIYPGQVRTYT